MSGVRASQPVQGTRNATKKSYLKSKSTQITVKMIEYIKESFEELKNNVSWPSWSQGQSLTVLVALFSIIFSLAIWGVDTVFARVVETYFNWIK